MTEIPVRARCSGRCGVHCDSLGEDTILLSSKDASALLAWLSGGSEPTFIPRSSSRLMIDDPGNGGLVLRIRPGEPQ
jgi:hypothetical protein